MTVFRNNLSRDSVSRTTLAVFVNQCRVLGVRVAALNHESVGFCGGLTTFSTFGRETFVLLQSGQIAMGLLYTALSVVIGVAAAWGGFALTR